MLNGVLSKNIIRLEPKYNITSLTVYFTEKELKKYRKSYFTYTESQRQEALNDPRIVHFTSTYLDNRPWVIDCNHPFSGKWNAYKEKSPWRELNLSKDNRSVKKKIARNMVMCLPKPIRIEFTGFIHAYIKPLKYLIK